MWEFFSEFWNDYTSRTIVLGTALLGAISGVLGSFAVLRKESLLGDAISHAALPGIAVAFLITGIKSSQILLVGAALSAILGTFLIRKIVKNTHLKSDTALALILSVFFGFGMLLLTFIQKLPDANQAGLDKFLFGQAATLLASDVILMAAVTGISLVILLLFWKEFKVLTFDSEYAHSIGVPTKTIDSLISFLIVIAIVLGLQTVGVVLMSAILLAPAAAARQWTNNLSYMLLLAGGIGSFSGVFGTAISASQDNLATGPVIVLVASFFVFISLVFSPSRGIVFEKIRHYKNRKELQLIKYLHSLSKSEYENLESASNKYFKKLKKKGWLVYDGKSWVLSTEGMEQISKIETFSL